MKTIHEQYINSLAEYLASENITQDAFIKSDEVKMLLSFSREFLLAWDKSISNNTNTNTNKNINSTIH
jgi:hypothetical protein